MARDKYLARDAADLVEVDYEVLQAVADPMKAIAPGAPPVHPEWPDNVSFNYHQEGGEVDQAFAEADVIVQAAHHQPAPRSERDGDARRRRRVALAADRQLNLYSSTQIPHLLRTLVAGMLALEENRVRVITPEVGGGFEQASSTSTPRKL